MNIRVLARYNDVTAADTAGKNVAVIDVFRTTTAIVTALARGALSIVSAKSINEARRLAHTMQGGPFLLAGERNALPITGFDMDNSPLSYTEESIRGKTIIMTTSNGTRAVRASTAQRNLYIASFANLSAVSKTLLEHDEDICIICSGTRGSFALEDGLCAGMIIAALERSAQPHVCDMGWLLKTLVSNKGFNIMHALENGSLAYRILKTMGNLEDIVVCLQTDTCGIVPVLEQDNRIRVLQ